MSESFLSQEEVDALLEGVTGESQKLEKEDTPTDGVRTYNLSSQERIVRGRMPTMEIVNERFSRNLRLGLFNFIRRSPEVSVGTVSVQRYSAFLRRLAVPTNFNIVAIRPLRGNGLVVCDHFSKSFSFFGICHRQFISPCGNTQCLCRYTNPASIQCTHGELESKTVFSYSLTNRNFNILKHQ